MTIQQLRKLIEKEYNLDLSDTCRKRKYVYAKKLFCYIGFYGLSYTSEEVGEEINIDHATVLYHSKTFFNVYNDYKIFYNTLVTNYGLDLPMVKFKEEFTDDSLKNINKILSKFSVEQLDDFFKTRLIPYSKMNKIES